ncbi:MAG: galactokinase [Parafilimonas sp.]|nr:galactokinase [Parafilimonas sp.]
MIERLSKAFHDKFKTEPLIVRSPGRVNIIGEHTDYNEGFVLPAAIDKAIYFAVSKRDDDEVHLHAVDFNEDFKGTLSSIKPVKQHWPNYVLGIIDQMQKKDLPVKGFNAVIDGDVPVGAGLSSSAALECATAFALNELFNFNLSKIEMVQMAQRAEHAFAGVKVGIMDMFASMFGKEEHAIKLDCRSLEYEYVPLHLPNIKIVLLNTNVKHSLSSSEYNVRRQQCEQGVTWIKERYFHVNNLRDATIEMLDECVLQKDTLIYKRCRFIVEEIQRLLSACEDLKKDDIQSLGQKMYATHEGLSNDYEVSCKELDFLVDTVKNNDAVLGARMMGGGFGGCTINLVKEDAIDELIEGVAEKYEREMKLPLTAYIAQIENGTGIARY